MKNKILTLLLIGATLISCSKEEIEPKQCWRFITEGKTVYSGDCIKNVVGPPVILWEEKFDTCGLTKTQAISIAQDIDKKGTYFWNIPDLFGNGSCAADTKLITRVEPIY
jgi:hypothetical protein